MQMTQAPAVRPLNANDRPGGARGAPPTKLSAVDKSGVVYKKAKPHDTKALFANHDTGIKGLDGKPSQVDADARHAQLTAHARQLVSQTFFGAMLKQMHESPFKSDLFDGGKGGKAFAGLADQRMVDQMSRGSGKKLVDAIVRKFEARQAYAKAAAGKAGTATITQVPATAVLPATATNNNPNREAKHNATPARRA